MVLLFLTFSALVVNPKTRVLLNREKKTRGTPEAVRNRTTNRGPGNPKICVESYKTMFLVNKSEIGFGVDRSFDCM